MAVTSFHMAAWMAGHVHTDPQHPPRPRWADEYRSCNHARAVVFACARRTGLGGAGSPAPTWPGCSLQRCSLQWCSLQRRGLRRYSLRWSNRQRCSLQRSGLQRCCLRWCSLPGGRLERCSPHRCSLQECRLQQWGLRLCSLLDAVVPPRPRGARPSPRTSLGPRSTFFFSPPGWPVGTLSVKTRPPGMYVCTY